MPTRFLPAAAWRQWAFRRAAMGQALPVRLAFEQAETVRGLLSKALHQART
ncbi:MAG: hypothetical protein HC828_10365 [Blastochloris sp.]|nr:hypothetical protein [Blastochloris sp.]